MPAIEKTRTHHPTALSERVHKALQSAGLTVRRARNQARELDYYLTDSGIYGLLNGTIKQATPATLWILHKVTGATMADLEPRWYKAPNNDLWKLLLEIQTKQHRSTREMCTLLGIHTDTYLSIIEGGKVNAPTVFKVRQALGLPPDAVVREPDIVAKPEVHPDEGGVLLPPPKESGTIPVTFEPIFSPEPKGEETRLTERQGKLAVMHWMMVQVLSTVMELTRDRTPVDWGISRCLASTIESVLNTDEDPGEYTERILRGLEIALDPKADLKLHWLELMRLITLAEVKATRLSDLDAALLNALRGVISQRPEMKL